MHVVACVARVLASSSYASTCYTCVQRLAAILACRSYASIKYAATFTQLDSRASTQIPTHDACLDACIRDRRLTHAYRALTQAYNYSDTCIHSDGKTERVNAWDQGRNEKERDNRKKKTKERERARVKMDDRALKVPK